MSHQTEQAAAETGPGRRPPSRGWRIAMHSLRTVLFVELYVLSIGPMFWFWFEAETFGRWSFFRVFYAPLRLACASDRFERWLNRYINWWIT